MAGCLLEQTVPHCPMTGTPPPFEAKLCQEKKKKDRFAPKEGLLLIRSLLHVSSPLYDLPTFGYFTESLGVPFRVFSRIQSCN